MGEERDVDGGGGRARCGWGERRVVRVEPLTAFNARTATTRTFSSLYRLLLLLGENFLC